MPAGGRLRISFPASIGVECDLPAGKPDLSGSEEFTEVIGCGTLLTTVEEYGVVQEKYYVDATTAFEVLPDDIILQVTDVQIGRAHV